MYERVKVNTTSMDSTSRFDNLRLSTNQDTASQPTKHVSICQKKKVKFWDRERFELFGDQKQKKKKKKQKRETKQ